MPLEELTWWVFALPQRKRYRQFEIQRRDGSPRVIHAPIQPLKEIQRKLARKIEYEVPDLVHGFVPERSPLSNARVHRKHEWVLRIDLADFFPSINFGRVRGLFLAYPFEYGPDAATMIAQTCCFDGVLPQGAPTSPLISNLICRSLDRDLERLAAKERCAVSRYADDLCLSSDQGYFPHHLAYIEQGRTVAGETIEAIVEDNGFNINHAKSRLMHRTQRQRVTGLVVNEKANVSRDYVRDLRNLLYIWGRHGEAEAIAAWTRKGHPRNWPPEKPSPTFAKVVRGRVQHVGSVKGWTDSTYLALARKLDEVDEGFVLRHQAPPAPRKDRRKVRLLTEGDSDISHILAAQRHFHRQGDFLDLELVIDDQSAQHGDRNLLRTCRGLAMTPQPKPCVCLFDRDNPEVLKEAVGRDDWKDWGNGVIAAAIVSPDGGRACIEMLYDEAVREIEDEKGRRLFLMSEFDDRSGLHESLKFNTPHPDRRKLLPDAVFAIGDNRSVLLSKSDFARVVESESGDFANVSFDGFRATFEVVREALGATSAAGS